MLGYPAPVNSSDSSDAYESSRDVLIYTSDCFLVTRRYDDRKGYRVLRPAPTGPLRLSAGYKLKMSLHHCGTLIEVTPHGNPRECSKTPSLSTKMEHHKQKCMNCSRSLTNCKKPTMHTVSCFKPWGGMPVTTVKSTTHLLFITESRKDPHTVSCVAKGTNPCLG